MLLLLPLQAGRQQSADKKFGIGLQHTTPILAVRRAVMEETRCAMCSGGSSK